MIERLRKTLARLSVVAGTLAAGCSGGGGYVEVPIQTPIAPKLDISPFQRVYVAGFLAGASDDLDANMETVRLLRSQLRNKNILRVVDADTVALAERAIEDAGTAPEEAGAAAPAPAEPNEDGQLPAVVNERDLDRYAKVFENKEFWKQVGEEHERPLIVTGSVLFLPHSREGFVQREQEVYDSFGRRQVVPVRTYQERKGFILRPTFVFIDGRTGEQLYSESFREEVLYNSNQQTPSLSSYFELMDRLLPTFLNTLSAQKIRGNRVLLK
jgi:hypothetical protein